MFKLLIRLKTNSQAISTYLKKNVQESVEENKQMQNELGALVTDAVKRQAKAGKPLVSTRKFPPLADSTIKSRERMAKYNSTDPAFRAKRSNLTFTGQLLSSIKYFINGSKITIRPDGKRSPYRRKDGSAQRVKNLPGNEKLSLYLAEKGFILFDRPTAESVLISQMNAIVRRYLRLALRKLNSK